MHQRKYIAQYKRSFIFALRDLDLSQVVFGPPQFSGGLVYDLYAVVLHHGSAQTGYYTAFRCNLPEARWYHTYDTYVKEMPAAKVKNASTYMLCCSAKIYC